MKKSIIKRCLSLCAALLIILSVVPAAHADDIDTTEYTAFSDGEEYTYTLNGMTWNELMSDFMAGYKIKDWQLGFGYYNTVTGESHFYNGDTYFTAASIYKLPLCMYFTDKINSGELDADGKYRGYRIAELIKGAIEASNNEYAQVMLKDFTRDKSYASEMAKYLGIDLEKEDPNSKYFKSVNFNFTPRQVIHCLNTIWSDPGSYQRIIDHMLKATPGNYFQFHQQEYTVAHKYGYLNDQGYLFVNDCGFCYTDDPICLIMFTKGVSYVNRDVLADYCTLMCDYAQASREQRLEAEAEAAEKAAEEERLQAEEQQRLAIEAEREKLRLEEEERLKLEAAAEEAEALNAEVASQSNKRLILITVLAALIAAGTIAIIVSAIKRSKA